MLPDTLPANPSDSFLPAGLYAVFALLSAGGGYWIVASHRSRRAGWIVAGATLAFFLLLFAGLKLLLGSGELG